MGVLNYGDHVAAIERESAALGAALAAGARADPVPTCPDWDLAGLAAHVGGVISSWTHAVAEGTGREKPSIPDLGEDDDLADWWSVLAASLVAELRAADGSTEMWTWMPDDQSAGFVARRMAHEVAIHRYDAQSAVGAPDPVDGPLAADGIEEIFTMVKAREAAPPDAEVAAPVSGSARTLHLHGTGSADDAHEWMITLAPEGLRVTHEHGKGDLALRGEVGDLELALYQRPPVGEIERFGDETALEAWAEVFTF